MPTDAREELRLLEDELAVQQREVAVYEAYFRGDHRLKFATDKFREIFGGLFGAFADNWMRLVVLAAVERLEVVGFRHGEDEKADKDTWDIWQANNLDNGSVLAHTEAGKCGKSYTIIDRNGGKPRITVEHPSQVIVRHAPGDRTVRESALKKWLDKDGHARANVYLPDKVHKFRSLAPLNATTWSLSADSKDAVKNDWQPLEAGAHGFDVVPVVPLYNDPSMLSCGESDLLVAIPLQDAINKIILDAMVDSEVLAFPQRVLTGVEIPKDENGNPLPGTELKAMRSKLWAFEDKEARAFTLEAASLDNYVKFAEMLIQHLAAQTRTPPHYLLSSIVNASGEALHAAEAGLVSKCEKKILDFSDPWEETMRLASEGAGKRKQAGAMDLETIWADPEKKTLAEKVDAAVKLRSIEVPHEFAWARAGFSPKEIERMLAMLPEEPETPEDDNPADPSS